MAQIRRTVPKVYLQEAGKDDRVEARRSALRSLIDGRNPQVSVAEIARQTGIAENAVSNFLCGRTSSLNVETAEPLARFFSVSLNELFGDQSYQAVKGCRIYLKGSVATGRLSAHFIERQEAWTEYAVPHDSKYANVSYLLRLDTHEMDQVYSRGTLLQVVDLADFRWKKLRAGNRLILLRTNTDGQIETLCREIDSCGDRTCRLVARSSVRSFARDVINLPWPLKPNCVDLLTNGSSVTVRSVVIASTVTELDDDQ